MAVNVDQDTQIQVHAEVHEDDNSKYRNIITFMYTRRGFVSILPGGGFNSELVLLAA